MSYKDKATEMYQMIGQGQMMEAFEKYYTEDCVMIEATGDVREGKDNNRAFEVKFLESVAEVHGGGVHNITSNEESGTTMVESWMDVTYKDGNRVKMEEVAIQQWEGEQIKRERFYYNMPGSN